MQLKRAGKNASDAHKTLHLYASFMEVTRGSLKVFVIQFVGANQLTTASNIKKKTQKAGPRQTDRQTDGRALAHTQKLTRTHTHLRGRSATYWALPGGFHNHSGTLATHTQVTTRRKQMRLHVDPPISISEVGYRRASRLQNTLLDASPCFLACRPYTLHPCF